MLFVMRTWSLVRSLNRSLGGTTRQRLLIIAEHAAAGALRADRAAAVASAAVTGTGGSSLSRWRARVVAAARSQVARLRMRFVVRLIDYVGLAASTLLHAASLVAEVTTRIRSLEIIGIAAPDADGERSAQSVKEQQQVLKKAQLREMG